MEQNDDINNPDSKHGNNLENLDNKTIKFKHGINLDNLDNKTIVQTWHQHGAE